jgi:hypothetical protein
MCSASLHVGASILALGVATSGMNFGGLHELMASPEKLVSRLVGWNWGETGKFFESRQRPQPIVYCLSRNVLRLWMRRPKNMTCVFLGKNEGSRE